MSNAADSPGALIDVIEEVRVAMEQNKCAAGSVHAGAVIRTLYQLGYGITGKQTSQQGGGHGAR